MSSPASHCFLALDSRATITTGFVRLAAELLPFSRLAPYVLTAITPSETLLLTPVAPLVWRSLALLAAVNEEKVSSCAAAERGSCSMPHAMRRSRRVQSPLQHTPRRRRRKWSEAHTAAVAAVDSSDGGVGVVPLSSAFCAVGCSLLSVLSPVRSRASLTGDRRFYADESNRRKRPTANERMAAVLCFSHPCRTSQQQQSRMLSPRLLHRIQLPCCSVGREQR